MKPKVVIWMHKAVLVARVAYDSVVWWPKAEEGLRGLVLRGETGAIRTTPTASLGMLLGVSSLHFDIKGQLCVSPKILWAVDTWDEA